VCGQGWARLALVALWLESTRHETRPAIRSGWLSVNAAPLYDDHSDEPTETVVALEDITDCKRANDALEQRNTASRELMNAGTQDITERAAGDRVSCM
jgi:hypothetical protein